MAELATIARPYAEALFKATSSEASAAVVWLDALAAVAADAALRSFAQDPNVSSQKVFDVMSGVLSQPLPEKGANFLRLLIDNGRVDALPEIAEQYRGLMNKLQGVFDAQVFSAYEIDASTLAELGQTLEKRFARKLNLHVQLQPELIGGVRVVVGDEVLDTSVKARLEQMKVALTA